MCSGPGGLSFHQRVHSDEGVLMLSLVFPDEAPHESEQAVFFFWSPRGVSRRVFFWIHGGGFVSGDAYENLGPLGMVYDGAPLVGRHDCVLLSHNYRMNALGFNTFTVGDHGETGSQAMGDQRLALQCTQMKVKALGGDPGLVTIVGQSAGDFGVKRIGGSSCFPDVRAPFDEVRGPSSRCTVRAR